MTTGAFWVGNPDKGKARSNWLATKIFNGYPSTHIHEACAVCFDGIKSKRQFKKRVKEMWLAGDRPSDFNFPPDNNYREWTPNGQDYTYAWFNNRVNVQKFDYGWKIWGDLTPWYRGGI
jgi:hypothetical protein